MAANGLYGNGPILKLSSPFLHAVETYASSPRQREDIENSVYSIDHKLNIVRYNAGLIQEMNAEDFRKHRYKLFDTTDLPRTAQYKQRCIFRMHDYDDYVLFLTFFLEAMTGASFSLLDVCGHLLKDMYDLNLPRTEVTSSGKSRSIQISFANVTDDLQTRATTTYNFLMQYRPGNPSSVLWIKPLKDIRNATTHQQITRICRYVEDSSLHFSPDLQELRLNQDFFTPPRDVVLKEFVEECFNGLEDFVTELYDRLRQALETDHTIPLY
ncbi:MAG: hypothetical protein L0332_31875 [Chloroflexi bacterium]|nr:hypothetical protein [Nitrososphaera sp.]MCI0645435.1 hypothetical protein [Chloroflexota bacterium]MCI0731301.1 hypothetical protein [Chloroflexota bacterium]